MGKYSSFRCQGVAVILRWRNSSDPAFSPAGPPDSPPRPILALVSATTGCFAVQVRLLNSTVMVSPFSTMWTGCQSRSASVDEFHG